MGSESNLWKTVKPKLSPFGAFRRVENRIDTGTPDVAYCATWQSETQSGWIELKDVHEWPVKPETNLTIEHLTQVQENWMIDWVGMGGRAYLLVQVKHDYLLFNAWAVKEIRAGRNREQLYALALVRSYMRFPTREILEWLVK